MKKVNLISVDQARWLIVLAAFSLLHTYSSAQSITYTFVNAAGFDDGVNCSLRWTIGEPMTTETTGENGTLRMGFLPFSFTEDLASAVHMPLDANIRISVAPNPATDQIRVKSPEDQRYLLRIISLDGRAILASDIINESVIDIHSWPPGVYVLYVLDLNGSYNSIQFIKS